MWGRLGMLFLMASLGMQPGSTSGAAPASGPSVESSSTELEQLRARLQQRELELKEAQARLQALDEEPWYSEAERLGVVRAVERSGMTERQRHRLAAAIVREARRNGLDPLLVVAVIRSESTFNNYAVSGVGAMGLMQLMPDTGVRMASRQGTRLGRKSNLFDAELNVELGTAYLAQLISQFDRVDQALVAYNAGPAAARRILANRARSRVFLAGYPRKVLAEYRKLQAHTDAELAQR